MDDLIRVADFIISGHPFLMDDDLSDEDRALIAEVEEADRAGAELADAWIPAAPVPGGGCEAEKGIGGIGYAALEDGF